MLFSPPAGLESLDNIMIVVVVVLLVFGSTQIPKLARSLGSAQKEFKKGLDEGAKEDPAAAAEVAAPVQAAPVQAAAPQPAPAQTPPAGDGSTGTGS